MNRRFWLVMAFFVGSFGVIVAMQRFYDTKFGSAFGLVVAAADGRGVEGARIELYAEFPGEDDTLKLPLRVETAADGRFRFKSTVGGEFRMSVVHPRYRTHDRERVRIETAADNDLGRIELERRQPLSK
ncbi:MAG: carboxypeptidase-like regulatory domain-containing protein [Planctomycetota bacterium JB042]